MATQPKPEQTTGDQVLTRLSGLETRLTTVEIDLAVVKSNYATKQDIARLEHAITAVDSNLEHAIAALDSKLEVKIAQLEARLIKWFVGTAVALSAAVGAIAFGVARFLH